MTWKSPLPSPLSFFPFFFFFWVFVQLASAAAAKLLQLCPTLCDPIDGSPPGSPIPGILQARILEWVAISFSKAWKWKVKVKSLSRVRLFVTLRTIARQAPQEWDSPGKNTGMSCYDLLQGIIPIQRLNPSLMSPALTGRFFTTPGKPLLCIPLQKSHQSFRCQIESQMTRIKTLWKLITHRTAFISFLWKS